MSHTTLQVGVKAVIKNAAGHYLALHNLAAYPGETSTRWDIPGGRIDPGEATVDALRREIREETGLALETIESILAVQDILRVAGLHVVRITYLATCENAERITLDPREHAGFRWLTLAEFQAIHHDQYLDPVFITLQAY